MAHPERRPVASLWIGTRLGYLNQLCLLSHVQQGHPTTLYCTDAVENVPAGVEVRAASEIMDIDRGLVDETSASFLSNVFRYKMIRATGAVWIDCDAFCHRPFPDEAEAIFAGHGMRGALNCGVMAIPREGALMDLLLDYYDNLPEAPPWFNDRQKRRLARQDPSLPHAARIYRAERTAFGPQAFTYFAKATGDYDRAMAPEVLYPVPFQLNDIFYDPHGRVEGWFTEATWSVHLYTNGTRPWWRKNPPLENSYAWRMCRQVGIDPSAALE
ncbi:hypothetical protein DXV76_07560 [Rhodobacteraceae bacterium CCMM004]|nr:hypothetical protein DXV76_07560 [Rhodobacteraceae bacterium CCMM004]